MLTAEHPKTPVMSLTVSFALIAVMAILNSGQAEILRPAEVEHSFVGSGQAPKLWTLVTRIEKMQFEKRVWPGAYCESGEYDLVEEGLRLPHSGADGISSLD
jgi:hypothetical protein